jgi:hypothetical protein
VIRAATFADIPAIAALAIKVLESNERPGMVVSHDKVLRTVRACVGSARNFACVSEQDGVVVGALGALVSPDPFHFGHQCSILMWYSPDGEGIAMIKTLKRWLDTSTKDILFVDYTCEPGGDPRIEKLIQRLGFKERIPMYIMARPS